MRQNCDWRDGITSDSRTTGANFRHGWRSPLRPRILVSGQKSERSMFTKANIGELIRNPTMPRERRGTTELAAGRDVKVSQENNRPGIANRSGHPEMNGPEILRRASTTPNVNCRDVALCARSVGPIARCGLRSSDNFPSLRQFFRPAFRLGPQKISSMAQLLETWPIRNSPKNQGDEN